MTCNLATSYQTLRHHASYSRRHWSSQPSPWEAEISYRIYQVHIHQRPRHFVRPSTRVSQTLRHFLHSVTWLQILPPPLQLQKHAYLCAHDFAQSAMLWHQPRLANVTCAWRWRLYGINPANILRYAIFWTVSGIWQIKLFPVGFRVKFSL